MQWAALVNAVPWRWLAKLEPWVKTGEPRRFQVADGLAFESSIMMPMTITGPSDVYCPRYEVEIGGAGMLPALSMYFDGVPHPVELWATEDEPDNEYFAVTDRLTEFHVSALYAHRGGGVESGNQLLRLLDVIGKTAGVTRYTLTDESCIELDTPTRSRLSLGRYGVIVHGATWYERHGLLPDAPTVELAQAKYVTVQARRQRFLSRLVNWDDLWNRLKKLRQKLKLDQHKSRNTAPYEHRLAVRIRSLNWLLQQPWPSSCLKQLPSVDPKVSTKRSLQSPEERTREMGRPSPYRRVDKARSKPMTTTIRDLFLWVTHTIRAFEVSAKLAREGRAPLPRFSRSLHCAVVAYEEVWDLVEERSIFAGDPDSDLSRYFL